MNGTQNNNSDKYQNNNTKPNLPPGSNKMLFGIVLILGGLFYLSVNLGIFPGSWHINIWRLWPILIIFIGLGIFDGRGWIPLLIGVIVTILILVILIFAIFIRDPAIQFI